MNQQLLSVFFCALICSTLGHEYFRAHELTHRARHNGRSHSAVSRYRDNNDSCSYICPVPKPSGEDSDIRLIIIKEVSVVAVLNVTAQVAFAVDLQANILVLFNGNSGGAILIDIKEETGISWTKGSNDKLWFANEISLVKYLQALGTLKNVKDFPNGQQFEIKSASKEIVTRIVAIISQLGSSIASRLKVNVHEALSIVLVISKVLVVTLGGSLSILIKKAEATEIILQAGLVELTTLLRGLASFSQKITGGLEAILIADVNFKLSLLLGVSSSLEAVVALLSQCANKIDLSKVLGPILGSPEAFLEAVISLGKGQYKGISGIETVVYHLLLVISKKISVTEFIDIIIQLAAAGGAVSKDKFTAVIEQVIRIIQIQVSTFKSSERWQVLLTFFSKLKAGNLTVGGVDISAIVGVIIENSGKTSLSLVVNILLKLSAVVGLSVAVAILFLRLVFFIISGQGVVYILQLLPNIKLNVDFSSDKSIISQIIRGVSVSKILPYILTLNIIGVITNLPVLGDILKAVGGALEAAGKSSSELRTGLKSSMIVGVFFGWIRYGFGLSGGSAPSGTIAGQIIIGGGINIDSSISQISSAYPSTTSSSADSSPTSSSSSDGSSSISSSISSSEIISSSLGPESTSASTSSSFDSSTSNSVTDSNPSSTYTSSTSGPDSSSSTASSISSSEIVSSSISSESTSASSGSSAGVSVSNSAGSISGIGGAGGSIKGGGSGGSSGGGSWSISGSQKGSGSGNGSGSGSGSNEGSWSIGGKGSSSAKGSGSVSSSGGGEWGIDFKHHKGDKKHQENRKNHASRAHN